MEQAKHLSESEVAGRSERFSLSSAAWLVLGIITLTFLELRVVGLIQGTSIAFDKSMALGILTGHPQWRAFQSRLLGPLLVEGLAHITHHPFSTAYNVVAHGLLLLTNAVCYGLFYRLGHNRRLAWCYTLAYAGMFIALQDPSALAIFDYVDLVTMLCFAYLVFTRTNLPLLAVLFFVELLNRESAAFIGLWIMLEAVRVPAAGTTKRLAFTPLPLLVGGGLIAVGSFWTHWIRDRLFISQTMPAASYYVLGDQLWPVACNTAALYQLKASGAVVPVIAVGALVALFVQPSVMPVDKKVKVGILLGVMLVSVFLFGRITETRVWFEFMPFALFLFYNVRSQPSTLPSVSCAPMG